MRQHTGNKSVISEVERGEICRLDWASIGICALGQELVNSIESIGLNGIIGSEDDELGNIRLYRLQVSMQNSLTEQVFVIYLIVLLGAR